MKKQLNFKKIDLKDKKTLTALISSIVAVLLVIVLIVFGVKSCTSDADKTDDISVTTPFPNLKGSVVYHASKEKEENNNLYLYDFEQNTLECLTEKLEGISDCKYADFSSDGKTVVFMAKDENNSYGIYTLNIQDKTLAKLDGDLKCCGYPACSPDGQKIAFTKADGDNRFIWEYDVATKESRQLTSALGFYSYPCYSQDGKYVYYSSGTSDDYNVIMRVDTSSLATETVYSEEYISCTNPQTVGNDFYFTKWFNVMSTNTVGVKYISDTKNVRDFNFNSYYYNCADLSPINNNYVLLSSDKESSDGTYELFVADCNSGTMWNLDTLNKEFDDLFNIYGADYFIADLSVYNLNVSDMQIKVESIKDKSETEFNSSEGADGKIKVGDTVTFTIDADGGYGNYDYSYYILKDGRIYSEEIRSVLPFISYTPTEAGNYTIQVYIEDEMNEMKVQSFKFNVE